MCVFHVCDHVCMGMRAYLCAYVYMCVDVSVYVYAMCIHLSVCTREFYVGFRVQELHAYLCACVRVCMRAFVCVCVCARARACAFAFAGI